MGIGRENNGLLIMMTSFNITIIIIIVFAFIISILNCPNQKAPFLFGKVGG